MYVTPDQAAKMLSGRMGGLGDGVSIYTDPNSPPPDGAGGITGDVADVTVSSSTQNSIAPLLVLLAIVALIYWLSKKD
jgi:hypothetical protein